MNLNNTDIIPRFDGKCYNISEPTSNNKWDSGFNQIASRDREGANVLHTILDFIEEIGGVEVEHFLGENATIIINVVKVKSVFKGLEVEFLEESCFGCFDLLACCTDFEIFGDLDLGLVDFGGDVKSMEKIYL